MNAQTPTLTPETLSPAARLDERRQAVTRRAIALYCDLHQRGEDAAPLERLLPFLARSTGWKGEKGETLTAWTEHQVRENDTRSSARVSERVQPFADKVTTRIMDLWDASYHPDREPTDLARILPLLARSAGLCHGKTVSGYLEERAQTFSRLPNEVRKATLAAANHLWGVTREQEGERSGFLRGASAVAVAAIQDTNHLIFADALLALLPQTDRAPEVNKMMSAALLSQLNGGTCADPCRKELTEAASENLAVVLKRLRENDPKRFAWVLTAIAATHPQSPLPPEAVRQALAARIGDRAWIVGFTAAWTLHRLGYAEDILRAVLPPKAGDPRQALHRLGRTGGGAGEHPALWEAALERMDDTEVTVRAAALEALCHLLRQQPRNAAYSERAASCAGTLSGNGSGLVAPLAASVFVACQEAGALANVDLFRFLRDALFGDVSRRPTPLFTPPHEQTPERDAIFVAVRLFFTGTPSLFQRQAFDRLREAAAAAVGHAPDRVGFDNGFVLLFFDAGWDEILAFTLAASDALKPLPCVLAVHKGRCRLHKDADGVWHASDEVGQAMARTHFGVAGHILVTGAVSRCVRDHEAWQRYLRDLGVRRIGGGREAHVFDLYSDKGVGVFEKPGVLVHSEQEAGYSWGKAVLLISLTIALLTVFKVFLLPAILQSLQKAWG